MFEDLTWEVVFRFVALSVTCVGAFVMMGYLKDGFNEAVRNAIASVCSLTDREPYKSLSILAYGSVLIVTVLMLTMIIVPGHDFALITAPSAHAFFSSIRILVLGFFSIFAVPAVMAAYLILLATYLALLMDAALGLTGGRMTSVLSVAFGVLSTFLFLSDVDHATSLLFVLGMVLVLLGSYIFMPGKTPVDIQAIKGKITSILKRVGLFFAFLFGLIVATFSLYSAYFNIFIADNDRVVWADALDCPVSIGSLQTIEDFFLAESLDHPWRLQPSELRLAGDVLFLGQRNYGLAVRTSGIASHAGISIFARQGEGEAQITNIVGAGGYFLNKGYFVYRFYNEFEDLFEGMHDGRVELFVSVLPQGSHAYRDARFVAMFGATYKLKRLPRGVKSASDRIILDGSWFQLPCGTGDDIPEQQ